jgi:site-specific DNA-methyltransferase (adenine-specific)
VTPYYADDTVTLYHGDARELLAATPDRTYDAVITDPPYSDRTHDAAKTNRSVRGHGVRAVTFDSLTEPELADVLTDCGRVTRRWLVATLDYRHAFHVDQQPPPGLRCLRVGVWVKPNPMPQISADRPGQGWEAIAFLHRDDTKPAWNGGGRSGVWTHPVAQNEGHPTSKPLAMVGDWVRLFTDHGDTVLDPFAGSGTTLRAAVDNGRRAVGCELDERYCEVIARRLSQTAIDFGGVA